jgi:hypothetical protein
MRDTNLGREPDEVSEFLDEYNVTDSFETALDRVNVNALGISIYSEDHGRADYDFRIMEETGAAIYETEVELSSVLMFPTGWGYYCCQSSQDLSKVREWFEGELEEYHIDGIMPLQDV